jgi:hypothetical protein
MIASFFISQAVYADFRINYGRHFYTISFTAAASQKHHSATTMHIATAGRNTSASQRHASTTQRHALPPDLVMEAEDEWQGDLLKIKKVNKILVLNPDENEIIFSQSKTSYNSNYLHQQIAEVEKRADLMLSLILKMFNI